jgi:hypothetical protein
MNKILAALLITASAGWTATLDSETSYDAKSIRGAFLSRGMAARPVGMGEAFTAVADDASAGSWNPAGLGQVNAMSAVATYDSAGQDLGVTYLAGAMPVPGGTAGLSVIMVSLGSYDERDATGEKLGSKSLSDMAFGGTYAFKNPSFLGGFGWTGVGVEFVSEAVGGSLIGLNLGGVYPLDAKLKAGWALQHVGPGADGFSLPAVAKAGVSYSPMENLGTSGDLGMGLVDKQMFIALGTEYTVAKILALRLGYKWAGDQGIDGLTGVTGGLGVRYGQFGFDYAAQLFGEMATSHRVALVWGMGEAGK